MITVQLFQFVMLLTIHYVGDFIVQTHWQASNKSKRMDALLLHILTYTLCLGIGCGVLFGPTVATAVFIGINAALHLCTDYVTSRISSFFYARQDWHSFFVVIGFDQLLHQVTLAVTMVMLL